MKKTLIFLVFATNLIQAQTYYRTVHPKVEEVMGVCARQELAFHIDKVAKFDKLRFYQYWSDDVGNAETRTAKRYTEVVPDVMKYRFNYSYNGNLQYKEYDQFYKDLNKRMLPILNAVSPWMRGYDKQVSTALLEQKPIDIHKINTNDDYIWNGIDVETRVVIDPITGITKSETVTVPPSIIDYMPTKIDQENPGLYLSQTKRMTQFTERYGSNNLPDICHQYFQDSYDALERAREKRGLNNVKYFECYNETDKWWREPFVVDMNSLEKDNSNLGTENSWFQMLPEQVAAMLSASYDGHGKSDIFKVRNTPSCDNDHLGILNVDSKAKLVMPGLAEFRGKYVYDLVKWQINNRRTDGPMNGIYKFSNGPKTGFDVINYHHYSTVYGGKNNFNKSPIIKLTDFGVRDGVNDLSYINYAGNGGASPEEDDLSGDINHALNKGMLGDFGVVPNTDAPQTIENIKQEIAKKEVWLTEFGYDSQKRDSDNDSPFRTPYATGIERRLKQAQWIMRSFLQVLNTNQIDRAYTYEVADGVNDGTFESCGLFTKEYQEPKESFYFYQTLKNVLNGYSHDDENQGFIQTDLGKNNYRQLNSDIYKPNLIVKQLGGQFDLIKDSIFCYKFKKGADVIYAIWSGTATSRFGTIDLPIFSNSQITISTIITPKIPDENGLKSLHTDISSVVGMNKLYSLNSLMISETPIFILINQQLIEENIPNNLPEPPTVEALCCGSVKVTWRKTAPVPCKYSIYYTKNNPDIIDFDLSKMTLYSDNIPGSYGSVTISGLKNGTYKFWVVPFNCVGDPATQDFKNYKGTPSIDINNGISSAFTLPPSIKYSRTNQFSNYNDIFSIEHNCNEMLGEGMDKLCGRSTGSWSDWNKNDPINDPAYYTIDFKKNIKINTLYVYHTNGQGRIQYEYQTCYCDQWKVLTTTYLRPRDCYKESAWENFDNFTTFAITKLRIKKLDESAQPWKFYFCTEDASCPFEPYDKRDDPYLPYPIKVNYNFINENNVGIAFPVSTIVNGSNVTQINSYKIKLSSQWIGDSLVNPMEIPLEINLNTAVKDVVVTDLLPGTNYKVKIEPQPIVKENCNGKIYVLPINGNFTTKGNVENNSNLRKSAKPGNVPMIQPEMFIYPNPAHSEINISLPSVGYTKLELYDISGRLLEEITHDPSSRYHSLETEKLSTGIYILKAYGLNNPILNSKFVKD
jgi:hypothetical protein